MPTDLRARLAGIQSFPQLVAFLRDDMGWPIERESFEDLTFDYTPEELGIDAKNAAKIQEIRRLRPLSAKQPWGVFFVKFEPKRLPVVALRRILSSVALKKRASANAAERTAWRLDDLLFLSSYGEGEERQISFAHFSAPKEGDDLPTLKVLGWDNLDTLPHLDAVARALSQHLSWPSNLEDREAWREQWRAAFTLRHREVITTSKALSLRLAELARAIHDRIVTALAVETDRGPLTKLMNAFREALVHDLTPESFADMYAQTITYGLLSARIADPTRKTADDFAAHMRTSPFLRELMEHFLRVGGRRGKAGGPGIDFDELGVSDVLELLDAANMEAVVADFGDKNRQEDPVIHFYEHFLAAYNKKLKVKRGVFYTPQPVVSYIVRSVHELLQTEFGLADGLADTTTWGEMVERHLGLKLPPLTDEPGEKRTTSPDEPFVQILDLATGTATFLVEVIEIIHRTLAAKWTQQRLTEAQRRDAWDDYVPRHLLPRLHAYELMMAPYAIAHMKIGLKLAETGYRFSTEERARVYLTNALEPWQKQLKLPEFAALTHEAAAVNEVKRRKRFTVLVGNPPYSLISANMEPSHRALIERYKSIEGERLRERGALQLEKILNDDYVKFIARSQDCLSASGVGLLGLVTNHAYLDNPTMRGLRHSFCATFRQGFFYDLGGSAKKVSQEAEKNVFDIQQGVAITIALKSSDPARAPQQFFHSRLGGSREAKYRVLGQESVATTPWVDLAPAAPYFLFVPTDYGLRAEYGRFVALDDVFPLHSIGCFTSKDHFVVSRDPGVLVRNATAFRDSSLPDRDLCKSLQINPKEAWDVDRSRKQIRELSDDDIARRILRFTHRPFDQKYIFFDRSLVWSLAYPVNRNLLKEGNLALVTSRQLATPPWSHVFCANSVVEMFLMSNRTKEGNHVFPLYVRPAVDSPQRGLGTEGARPNFRPGFLQSLAARMRLLPKGRSSLPTGLTPEDIFHYVYAVFHSGDYRRRYVDFLKIDFPRVPLTENLELFRSLAQFGDELTALHLLESPKVAEPKTEFVVGGREPWVEKVLWSDNTVWVDRAQTTGFKGVREADWTFHIGSYQVCEKWLRDRKGQRLSKGDIGHYQKIVVAISETIRIMKEIDEVIDQHGGWPGAFQPGESKVLVGGIVPFRPPTVEPRLEERYVTCVPLVPLRVAAGAFREAQPALDGDDLEWVEVGGGHRLRPGMFVAQVVGKSMEAEIPDEAYCLFRAPVEGSRQGKTVLVELRDAVDPETGERYTVKRYESEKREGDGSWRHAAVTLKPVNPEFEPIVLDVGDEERLRVVAELVEVLNQPSGNGSEMAPAPAEEAPTAAPSKRTPWAKAPVQRSLLDEGVGQLDLADAEGEPVKERISPARPQAGELDRDELVCALRALLSDGRRSREQAIRDLARDLGYDRTGPRIHEAIDNAIRTAVRRGVLANDGDELSLNARNIEQYDRAFLKEQFLAALGGSVWIERGEAARAFARWMGFRRTGATITESVKSLVNGLLREGRLEAEGTGIRRVR